MPRVPQHALLWSEEQGLYERSTQGQLVERFSPGDEAAWGTWLGTVTSLAFHGRAGSLNVYQEARSRGGQYWYAYHTSGGRTRKRYLGSTEQVSLARLETTAQSLALDQTLPRPPALPSFAPPPSGNAPELLVTKLAPPRLPHTLVPRERLLPLLEGALVTPLTLLSASAGWGKTTLLASWASRHPHQIAWLSLDTLDNELTRFWTAVIAALRTCVPGVGAGALAMLRSPQPPPVAAVATVLLNELAKREGHAAPLLLLLDDYQVIEEPTIQEALAFWMEHQPPPLHLLLSSRVDPDLPLARWRAQGRLTELRAGELRFRPEEASTLLQHVMGLALTGAEVAALQQRTEGWAAGLQLAALSLRQQEDRSAWIAALTGSQRYLLDYVQQEILPGLPLPLQRFLVQVAILRRMNAALAEAVTGEPNSQELLEALERRNLFVVPLDEQRQWYRLHDLFREALLAHLQASQPDALPHLHRRAAPWYEAAGEVREAIAHALEAQDFSYAARLVEQAAPRMWVSGEAQTVHTWVLALPEAVLRTKARLALEATYRVQDALYLSGELLHGRTRTQLEQGLDRLERVMQTRSEPALPEAEVRVITRRLRLLRGWQEGLEATIQGDAETLAQFVGNLQPLAEEEEEVIWKLIPHLALQGLQETLQRAGGLLVPQLRQLKQEAIRSGDQLITLRVMRVLAFAYFRAGQWHNAEHECLAGLALATQQEIHTQTTGSLYLWLSWISALQNRLEDAAASLQHAMRIARTWQQIDHQLTGAELFVRLVALPSGEVAAAAHVLQEAEDLLQQHPIASHRPWIEAARVWYWLKTANLTAASRWAEQAVFDPQRWDPNQKWGVLMLARVYLAQHRPAQALELLERFRLQLDQPGDIPNALEWQALSVMALSQNGQHEQALHAAARLVQRTAPENAIRLYLDEGLPMRQVLQRLLAQLERPAAPREELAPAAGTLSPPAGALTRAFLRRVLAAFEHEAQGARRSLAPGFPTLVTPLTQREQEVLRLLAEGASNQAIAQTLVIQLSTVKKHVSSLLGKLGATSRTQALAQARERSLL